MVEVFSRYVCKERMGEWLSRVGPYGHLEDRKLSHWRMFWWELFSWLIKLGFIIGFWKNDDETNFYQQWNPNWITHKKLRIMFEIPNCYETIQNKMSSSHENQTQAYHSYIKESF